MSSNPNAPYPYQENFSEFTAIDQVIEEYRGLMVDVRTRHDARYKAVTVAHRTAFGEVDADPKSHNIPDVLQATQNNLRFALEPTLAQVKDISLAASKSITPMMTSSTERRLLAYVHKQGRLAIGSMVDFASLPPKTKEAITLAGDHRTLLRVIEKSAKEGITSNGIGAIIDHEMSSLEASQATRRATDTLSLDNINMLLKRRGEGGVRSKDIILAKQQLRPDFYSAVSSYLDMSIWEELHMLRAPERRPDNPTVTALRRKASTPLIGDVLVRSLAER